MNNAENRPDAKYTFKRGHYIYQGKEVLHNWLFIEKHGEKVKSDLFPAKWKRPPKGVDADMYITYRETVDKKMKEEFPMSFSIGNYKDERTGKQKVRNLTGVKPALNPYKLYGDDVKTLGLNDAILFEFSDDMESLNVYFFFGKASRSKELWEMMQNDELCLTVDPIFIQKENPPTECSQRA